MNVFGTRRLCPTCDHPAYPAVVCGRGERCTADMAVTGPAPAYEPHWHCEQGCQCTPVGCVAFVDLGEMAA